MLRPAAFALLFGLAAPAVDAATVIRDDANATAIKGLDVEGFALPFNVDFAVDAPEEAYEFGFDVDTLGHAQDVTTAIVAALNADGNVDTVGPDESNVFIIGYDFNFDFFPSVRVEQTAAFFNPTIGADGAWFQPSTVGDGAAEQPFTVARLTPVPVPAALPLFGTAVVGLALWRRARRAPSS